MPSVSELRAFARCQRLHSYLYTIGLASKKTEALDLGTLVHAGLEAYFRDRCIMSALQVVNGSDKAAALLTGYHERWRHDTLTTIAVELPFELSVDGVEFRGRIDAIVQDSHGLWVLEHKTTSSAIDPASAYWDRIRLDDQLSGYVYAARALGFDVEGAILDVIRKPALRLRKDETPEAMSLRYLEALTAAPDEYYRRACVVRLEVDLVEWVKDFLALHAATLLTQSRGHAPKNPAACFAYGTTCEFLGLCDGTEQIENRPRKERRE